MSDFHRNVWANVLGAGIVFALVFLYERNVAHRHVEALH